MGSSLLARLEFFQDVVEASLDAVQMAGNGAAKVLDAVHAIVEAVDLRLGGLGALLEPPLDVHQRRDARLHVFLQVVHPKRGLIRDLSQVLVRRKNGLLPLQRRVRAPQHVAR